MSHKPLQAVAVLLGLFIFQVASGPPALPSPARTQAAAFTGLVSDGFGNALNHVLVLLTPLGRPDEVRAVVTDPKGRYRFEGIPAGSYRVTAFKEGYDSAVGRVSSWVGRGLDLVLAPANSDPARPKRADWILTAPPRDILREMGARTAIPALPGPLGGAQAGTEAAEPAAAIELARRTQAVREFFRNLTGEIQQTFSESAGGSSSGSDPSMTSASGRMTGLRLGSPMGERAAWDVFGQREKESASVDGGGIEAREATAERVRTGFRFDTAREGRFDLRAYYDHDAFLFDGVSPGSAGGAAPLRERRAWGYDAGWTGTVGRDASLQVDLGYLGSRYGARGIRSGGGEEAEAEPDADPGVETRLFKTSARVSQKVGSAHSVDVDVKARVYSFGQSQGKTLTPSAGQDPSLFTGLASGGWTVNVNAAESWSVTAPIALEFGFDLSRDVTSAGEQMQALVPQAGVTWSPDPETTVRGVVSYVAAHRLPVYHGRGESAEEGDPAGYRLGVERKIGGHFKVAFDAQSRPLFYDFIGPGSGATSGGDGRSLYLSDVEARVRQASLSVESRVPGKLSLGFGAAAGHVQGRLAAAVPEGELLRSLVLGDLRYIQARISSKIEKAGTEVRIYLTELGQRAPGLTQGEIYSDRQIQAELIQNLAFLHIGETDWSVLLAYRSFTPQEEGQSAIDAPDSVLWSSLSRISGGVSVRF